MYKLDKSKINDDKKSILYWLIMLYVIMFLFITPFQKALFNGGSVQFERPIYTALVWSAIALFLLSIYFFYNWKLSDKLDVLSLFIWLIPISCLVSVINSASFHLAMNSVYIHVMYSFFFLVGLYFSKTKFGLNVIIYSIVVSGYMLVIYGLMNWFGNANFQDAILGNRLSNVFQYPNTYAAYLIGLFFSSMLLTSLAKKWYMILFHSFMFVPILISIFLTSSSGGLLVFPVILIIYLLLSSLVKQIFNLFYLMISGIASLLIFRYVKGLLKEDYINGWLILVAVSLGVALIIYITNRYIGLRIKNKYQSEKTFQWSSTIIPAIMSFIALVAIYALFGNLYLLDKFPGFIKEGVASFKSENSSMLYRLDFYKESIDLIKDYPLIGAGGGAWSNLYQSYQSYPYTSNQAHSFFFQYLLEVGLIGFIIFISLLIYNIVIFIKHFTSQKPEAFEYERIIFFLFMSSILIHSVIDFDMSFVYIGALLFICLGGLPSFLKDNSTVILFNKWHKLIPVSICVLSVVIIIASIRMVVGNSLFIDSLDAGKHKGDFNLIKANLDKTLEIQPNHPSYVLAKVDLLKQAYQQTKEEHYIQEAYSLMNQIKKKEPHNQHVFEIEYSLYVATGQEQEAINLVLSKLNASSWGDINLYEKLISLQFQFGYNLWQQGSKEESNVHWNNAIYSYHELIEKNERIKDLPKYQQLNSRGFEITPLIALSIGQVYYMKQEFQLATLTFDLGRKSSDFKVPLNKVVARWYLASLQKQNIQDENVKILYNLLLEADPSEAKQIQAILDLKL
jgi:O-antigen ligase